MKKLFLFIIIPGFIFTSCKKDKDKNDCSLTEANLAGNYKVTAAKYKAAGTTEEIDFYALGESCSKDDIYTFNTNKTYAYSDAGTTCSPNGDDSGDWSLSGNIFTLDGDPFTVENYSCGGFTLVASDYDEPGDKITITYTKQ